MDVIKPRRVVLVLVGAAALLGFGGSAWAGGSGPYLEPVDTGSRSSVFNVGDRVHLLAPNIYKEDRAWYGPYVVYLRPDRPDLGLAGLAPAGEGATDVAVGNLEVNRIDDHTVTAEITFTMPKLDDGSYLVMTCNAKCANPLGQLQTSSIMVGAVPLPTLPPSTVFTTPSTVPTVTAKVGNVATTSVRAAAPAPAPVVREVAVPTTNWAAIGAAFAFGLAVAWGVPSWRARRRRDDRPRRAAKSETDVSGFIPVEAVHEESLV